VKPPTTSAQDKPTMNEGAFQRLLQAAYVLQQHNERAQSGIPEYGYGRTLAGILEIQEQVRNERLDLQATASLIARRIRELTQASGAAVGMLDHDQLDYYAASGNAAGEAGARAPVDSTLAAECLRTGLVVQCPRAESDARLSPELCRQLSVKALIVVPVSYQGKVAGVLELHFAQPDSFTDHDLRTCQLMAALLAESIASDAHSTNISPVSSTESRATDERAQLLAALEKIKPSLGRLATGSGADAPSLTNQPPAPLTPAPAQPPNAPSSGTLCESCGHELAEDELFCGSCGVARRGPNPWASLWEMQRAAEKSTSGTPAPAANGKAPSSEAFDVLPSEVEDIVASFSEAPSPPSKVTPIGQPETEQPKLASTQPVHAPLTWTFPRPAASALEAERELQSLRVQANSPASGDVDFDYADETTVEPTATAANPQERIPARFGSVPWLAERWRAYRASIYVGLAALLLLSALLGWWTPEAPPAQNGSTTAAGHAHKRVPPQPELSLLDKMLIDLGLAEAPATPVDPGNPNTQVWIDVHTALYYCPGADLYGKTPGGRLTTQQDAEQDQFQPAARRPCE